MWTDERCVQEGDMYYLRSLQDGCMVCACFGNTYRLYSKCAPCNRCPWGKSLARTHNSANEKKMYESWFRQFRCFHIGRNWFATSELQTSIRKCHAAATIMIWWSWLWRFAVRNATSTLTLVNRVTWSTLEQKNKFYVATRVGRYVAEFGAIHFPLVKWHMLHHAEDIRHWMAANGHCTYICLFSVITTYFTSSVIVNETHCCSVTITKQHLTK